MINRFSYDQWQDWDGASEGSGRSEKKWLFNNDTNEIGLFKFPKSTKTTEHVSEKLAVSIAEVIGIKCARVEIGTLESRIGCMSYLINVDGSRIEEGVNLITASRPYYGQESLYDGESEEYYSIDMIEESIENLPLEEEQIWDIKKDIFKMQVFDALIGNTDRHQSNWALLHDQYNGSVSLSPLYDNGSSLCAYIQEEKIDSYLGKDDLRFRSLVDSKSTSRIRINKKVKQEPSHHEVLEYIRSEGIVYIGDIADRIVDLMTDQKIHRLIDEFPEYLLSDKKKALISKFLASKREIICTSLVK